MAISLPQLQALARLAGHLPCRRCAGPAYYDPSDVDAVRFACLHCGAEREFVALPTPPVLFVRRCGRATKLSPAERRALVARRGQQTVREVAADLHLSKNTVARIWAQESA